MCFPCPSVISVVVNSFRLINWTALLCAEIFGNPDPKCARGKNMRLSWRGSLAHASGYETRADSGGAPAVRLKSATSTITLRVVALPPGATVQLRDVAVVGSGSQTKASKAVNATPPSVSSPLRARPRSIYFGSRLSSSHSLGIMYFGM